MKPPRVLIVEDQRALALALAAAVRQSGAASEIAPSAAVAREQLNANPAGFSAMILDIGLPDENGLEMLAGLSPEKRPPTLVVTAHGEIDNTITARKLGVAGFLTKPLNFSAFNESLRRILPADEAPAEAADQPERSATPFIGGSPAMRPVFQQIAHACATGDPVLISGETGTGKSLAASMIRNHGAAAAGTPFADFRPGAGDQVTEFQDALERAASGILLIEGIENLDDVSQGELIRRLETEGAPFPRILATSGPDLREAVQSGTLRSELYYRLQVLEVRLPPLRERIDDLPALFDFFLAEMARDRTIRVDAAAMKRLQHYAWPGNLHELRNVATFAAAASGVATRITPADLPDHLGNPPAVTEDDPAAALDGALAKWLTHRLDGSEDGPSPTYRDIAGDLERRLIRHLLERHDGKLARLAAAMSANRTTLRKKLRNS